MPLIFCVFATKRGVITKYAKYEEVGCQENSLACISMIFIFTMDILFRFFG